MSSHRDPPRLRGMGAELPDGLAAALEPDVAEFPEAAQLSDLTNRLGPLLGTATMTAAASIPVGLMAPKAPLSMAGTIKLLAVKWGHSMILPMAIGAASGGVVWEAREYLASHDAPKPVMVDVAAAPPTALGGKAPPHETIAASDAVESAPAEESAPSTAGNAAPEAPAGSALGAVRAAAGSLSSSKREPPAVVVDDNVTEIELIDRALRALARQPGVARRWVDEHMRRFPNGTFVQERETVAIEALVGEGRLVEARARAFEFRVKFPHSTYLRRIEAVLRSPKVPQSN